MKRVMIAVLAVLAAACSRQPSTSMQGYGEADYIYLASQESGVLSDLFVREGDSVERGMTVFKLEPNRLAFTVQSANASRAALAQAVQAAEADSRLAARNYARSVELARQGFVSRAKLDADRAARDAASARADQARRQLSAAGADSGLAVERLSDLNGAAPLAGTIERIYHRQGEVVAAGAPIAALLAPENMKVRFFAPEAMLARLPVGAQIAIACDGCPPGLTAHVIRVATEPQFTPPVIYSLEQRQKLVFLVEARPDRTNSIRPGIPIDVRLP